MPKESLSTEVSCRIMRSACKLFMEQGFRKTTMRQIASDAQVGLGLINYYFKSKENIALSFYTRMRKRCKECIDQYITQEKDPYTYLALMIYLEFTINLTPSFYKLYYDCLENGVFEKYIMTTDTEILDRIMMLEKKTVSHDLLQLYSVFVCAYVEKTLVVNKKKGLFPTIAYEHIPEYVFRSSAGTFSDNTLALNHAIETAKRFVQEHKDIVEQFTVDWILAE